MDHQSTLNIRIPQSRKAFFVKAFMYTFVAVIILFVINLAIQLIGIITRTQQINLLTIPIMIAFLVVYLLVIHAAFRNQVQSYYIVQGNRVQFVKKRLIGNAITEYRIDPEPKLKLVQIFPASLLDYGDIRVESTETFTIRNIREPQKVYFILDRAFNPVSL